MQILQTRVEGTALVARTMAELAGGPGGPRVLVCASGAHYYGDRGDEVLTEAEQRRPRVPGRRGPAMGGGRRPGQGGRPAGRPPAHRPRPGRRRGRPAQAGPDVPAWARRPAGLGRQWLSWTSLEDIVGAYVHALTHDELDGPVNTVAPNPVTNAEFTATLARVLHRPALLPIPEFGPKLVLGEAANEFPFVSQRAHPVRLLETGYQFQFPELEPALRHTLDRPKHGSG